MQQFIPVAEARRIVAATVPAMPSERVPPADALGRTLAETIRAEADVPPFANAAMDGYAVRAADFADGPRRLRCVGLVAAGVWPETAVAPGTCLQIMTGAPMPPGADTVVPVEHTRREGDAVTFDRLPEAGRHVRPAGKDVRAGATAFEPGVVVTPPVVGMLAAVGCAAPLVARAPRVAVVATGDELTPPGVEPAPGHIRNANGPALAAQAAAAGGAPLPPLVAADDPAALRAALDATAAADVLVFSGGVSMGVFDVVRDVLGAAGVDWQFWQVRQRPGKPLAYGLMGGRPVFGLPGNPVSASVCFEQYVRPALARMLGRPEAAPRLVPAVLEAPVAKEAGLYHFVRGVLRVDDDGRLRVRPTGPQDSNLYGSMVAAAVLIHLPEPLAHPAAGDVVAVEPLPW